MDGTTRLGGCDSSSWGPLVEATHAHAISPGEISVPLMTSPGAALQKVEQNQSAKDELSFGVYRPAGVVLLEDKLVK